MTSITACSDTALTLDAQELPASGDINSEVHVQCDVNVSGSRSLVNVLHVAALAGK